MRSRDAWLQDSAAYEQYSELPAEAPTEDELVEDERRRYNTWIRRINKMAARTISPSEARCYRIEHALQEIEEAATIAQFRPEVIQSCCAEIRYKTKQIRQDMGGL
jgi:hypothetical protein